ncbi:MAG: methyltransferase domain-containing protein [Acidobacteria bacterium]|nr:methyltransferase domain-containing protein [Acidobacteriota bacterium]
MSARSDAGRARAKGSILRRVAGRFADAVTRRHVALLPREARDERLIFDLRAPYRVEGDVLSIELLEPEGGRLQAVLSGDAGTTLWTGASHSYDGPCRFQFNLETGDVTLDGAAWGRADARALPARFSWRFTRTGPGGSVARRTSHYRAGATGSDVEPGPGDEIPLLLAVMTSWRAGAPLLDVVADGAGGAGAAQRLRAVDARFGIAGVGLDLSRAADCGAAHATALQCDRLPAAVRAEGPFRTILMISVLERLGEPRAALSAMTALAVKGTVLVVDTFNADSLSRRIFGGDWEGYADPAHVSSEAVSARTVPTWLDELGWRVVERRTRHTWDRSDDPTHQALRDWWDRDARFRRLLVERDLGDRMLCVAIKS